MTFDSKALWLGGFAMVALFSGCIECDSPNGDCSTEGEATVDLDGPRPVFGVVGLSEDANVPNSFGVWPCDGRFAWNVEGIDEPTGVIYGVLPKGAREEAPARDLEDGRQYFFAFVMKERNPLTDYWEFNSEAWRGTFVQGEPDSFVLGGECPVTED